MPYDLTELQRAANEKYGYSAKKTLSVVQSLYEVHKIVSYPRTDSKYLSTDMISTMKERLQAVGSMVPEALEYAKKGAEVVQKKVFNNEKVTDHHALIPTEQRPDYARLSSDEHRIYGMIVKRFVMLFAPEYREQKEKSPFPLPIAGSIFPGRPFCKRDGRKMRRHRAKHCILKKDSKSRELLKSKKS